MSQLCHLPADNGQQVNPSEPLSSSTRWINNGYYLWTVSPRLHLTPTLSSSSQCSDASSSKRPFSRLARNHDSTLALPISFPGCHLFFHNIDYIISCIYTLFVISLSSVEFSSRGSGSVCFAHCCLPGTYNNAWDEVAAQ